MVSESRREFDNALGALASLSTAMKRGEARREGDVIVYKVEEQERSMSLEEIQRYRQIVGEPLKAALELTTMLKKLDEKPRPSY